MHQRAYFRRRGWLAWHIAVVSRADLSKVSLEQLTGEGSRGRQTAEQTLHSVRLWKAALQKKTGDQLAQIERKPE